MAIGIFVPDVMRHHAMRFLAAGSCLEVGYSLMELKCPRHLQRPWRLLNEAVRPVEEHPVGMRHAMAIQSFAHLFDHELRQPHPAFPLR